MELGRGKCRNSSNRGAIKADTSKVDLVEKRISSAVPHAENPENTAQKVQAHAIPHCNLMVAAWTKRGRETETDKQSMSV